MIVSRVIAPASKLATAKALDPATAPSSLGVELGLGDVDEDELYAATQRSNPPRRAQRRDGLETRKIKPELTY